MSTSYPSHADAERLAVRPIISTDGGVRITLSTTSAATAVDVDAFLASGGASAATAQTIQTTALNGVIGQSALGVPRRVTVTLSSHADWDATTATLTAVDYAGVTQTESLTIPNGGNATLTSTGYYRSVTSLAIPAQSGTGGTFTIGYDTYIPAGHYAVALDKTGGIAWACWGGTAVLPATGNGSAQATFPVRDGDVIRSPGGTALSCILTGTGTTGELAIVRLA